MVDPSIISLGISLGKAGFKGSKWIYAEYKNSLLQNKLLEWQERVRTALADVLAVKEYLTDDEIVEVTGRVQKVLEYIADLDALCSNKSTWIHARKETKIAEKMSNGMILFAHRTSSLALTRQLGKNKVDKKGLLDRIKAKFGGKAATPLEFLADVINGAASVDSSTEGASDTLSGGEFPAGLHGTTKTTEEVFSSREGGLQLDSASKTTETSYSLSTPGHQMAGAKKTTETAFNLFELGSTTDTESDIHALFRMGEAIRSNLNNPASGSQLQVPHFYVEN